AVHPARYAARAPGRALHHRAGPRPGAHRPARHGTAPTRAYTEAAPYQGPAAVPSPPAPRTRPGPPRVVAVPVLLVALICFAVGIWALTQT
ncbi:hypothetical protein GA0115239_104140, partial [Streptomyces sp. BpilaLS-43]